MYFIRLYICIGVKQSTRNDFVYGELGRIDHQSRRYLAIISIGLKWLVVMKINILNKFII